MKHFFQKIASFSMATVVLLSTMSFTLDMHCCGETLVSTAVFHKAKTCGMDMEKINSCQKVIKKDCCCEKQVIVNEVNVFLENYTTSQQFFIASFIYSYQNLFDESKNKVSLFEEYRPPLAIKQIFKLDETYLI